MHEQVYSKDIELLAVSMRSYYLPREFTQVIVFAVHIPPSAYTDAACDVLHSVTSSLQTQHPQALFLFSGASIMPLCPPLCPHSFSMSPATPETIKHWTYFMPTAKRHTNHPPSFPWEHLTTTWCISCLCTSPVLTGNQQKPAG